MELYKKNKRHLSHAVSEVMSPGTAELGGSGLESLRKLQPSCQRACGRPKAWLRVASDMAHSSSSWLERAGRQWGRWEWKVLLGGPVTLWARALSRVQLSGPRGLQPARLPCPWDSPGKDTAAAAMPSSGHRPDPGTGLYSCVSCIGRMQSLSPVAPRKPTLPPPQGSVAHTPNLA